MKEAGPALGFGRYADAIARTADGRYEVADPTTRSAIMKLRSDPAASAMMAGAFTRANAEQLAATTRPRSRPRASSISRISSAPTAPPS